MASVLPGQTISYQTLTPSLSPSARREKKTNLIFFLIILTISVITYFIIQGVSVNQCTDPEKDKECIRIWGIIPPGIVTSTVLASFFYVLFIWLITYFYLSRIRYE